MTVGLAEEEEEGEEEEERRRRRGLPDGLSLVHDKLYTEAQHGGLWRALAWNSDQPHAGKSGLREPRGTKR